MTILVSEIILRILRNGVKRIGAGGEVRIVRHFKGRRYIMKYRYIWKSILDPRAHHPKPK